MQFVINREPFLKELQLLQSIIDKKNTIPILSNLLLETAVEKNEAKLIATDLEVGMKCRCQAKVKKGGALTISAKKLYEIVRALPEAEITIEQLDNNWISIVCQKAQFKIVGMPKEEYPSLPDYDFSSAIRLPSNLVKDMISKTAFAATQEDTRFALNGGFMNIKGDMLTMVATDAHRLCFFNYKMKKSVSKDEIQVIIPKKALLELRAMIEDADEIAIGRTENHIFFQIGERILLSRLIEGQYPNYEKVIPKDNDKSISLPTKDMAAIIRRISLLSNERSKAIKIRITQGKLEVSSNNPELGEAQEEIDISYKGEELIIGFNAQYLIDFFSVVDDENIVIEMKDEASQGLLKPAEEHDYSYFYVVMPMRL
jgi:DNA polymerase-3 subunit beta